MTQIYKALLITLGIGILLSCNQNNTPLTRVEKQAIKALNFRQLRIDTLFDSNQIVSLLSIQKSELDQYDLQIAYHDKDLIQTSQFAESADALAAINGGFFDIKNGGSITYLEVEDSIAGVTNAPGVFNGAIVIPETNEIIIEPAKPDDFYRLSDQEEAVLITGPLLLQNSNAVVLPNRPIVHDRHPRTCLCTTDNSILFITIDGRSMQADGMTLPEVQDYLLQKKCIDAINLDGGGSTTMWLKNKGIVNYPSDITGERPVANALLIFD